MNELDYYRKKYPELLHIFSAYLGQDAGYINDKERLMYDEIVNKEILPDYPSITDKQKVIQEIDSLLKEVEDEKNLEAIIGDAFYSADIWNTKKFLQTEKASNILIDMKARFSRYIN